MADGKSNTSSYSGFKRTVRKIIPVRASVFEKRHNETAKALKGIAASIETLHNRQRELSTALEGIAQLLATHEKAQADASRQFECMREQLSKIEVDGTALVKNSESMQQIIAEISPSIEEISERLIRDRELAYRREGFIRESVWAATFQQTISTPSEWLKGTSFAPGRWAVGFPFLYVLYRTLNEMRPTSILELGLGQSTKMIGQYAAHYKGVSHRVVEHDATWVEFWKRSDPTMSSTEIEMLALAMIEHPAATHEVRCYAGFKEAIANRKYDLISIDAPFGYDMTELARIDALNLVPDRLKDSFAIIIDDYNRTGEQGMTKLLNEKLKQAGIPHHQGVYRGEKSAAIIASDNLAFLCSM